MKYYLIAGEASGDLHGSNLMKALKKYDSKADFRFFGGDKMKNVGGQLVGHYKEMAYMGLDVVVHLRGILKKIKYCKQDILNYNPDVVILIDYPGFNFKILKFAHKNNIRVFYYIAPKVWAWRKNRIKDIKKYVNKLFVIFPFEVDFFRSNGIEAEYYGNPLIDEYYSFLNRKLDFEKFTTKEGLSNKPIIALVPGSRKNEVSRLLPEMLDALKDFSNFQLVIAGMSSLGKEFYDNICRGYEVSVVFDDTYNLISNSVAAVVTSGTATLETAILGTPQVVIFKTAQFTYFIGKPFVNIVFFSLVNIISNKEVVKELLQHNLAIDIKNEISKILNNDNYRNQMMQEYKKIFEKLGEDGVAERIAIRMLTLLEI